MSPYNCVQMSHSMFFLNTYRVAEMNKRTLLIVNFNGFFCYGSSSVCFLPACQLAGRGRASAASQLGHHGGQASAPRQSQLCGICLLLHFELFVEESGRFLNMDPQNQFHCCKECYLNKNVVMFTMAS